VGTGATKGFDGLGGSRRGSKRPKPERCDGRA